MNLSKFLTFALVVILFACEKDDPQPTCAQADWLGTYTGTAVCDGNSSDVTVTIRANGTDEIIIQYVTGPSTTTFDPLTVEGCDLAKTALHYNIQ